MSKVFYQNASDIIEKASSKIKSADFIAANTQQGCIYTKGVFDIFHSGHMSLFYFLENIKTELSLPVVVSVTSDDLVKVTKGDMRPIIPQRQRAKLISLINCVDFVHLNVINDLSELIKIFKPTVYVKGMDTAISSTSSDIEISNKEFQYLTADTEIIIFCDDGLTSSSEIIATIVNKMG